MNGFRGQSGSSNVMTPQEKLVKWNSILDCLSQIKVLTATLGMIPMSIHGEVEILEALILMEMRHLEAAVNVT